MRVGLLSANARDRDAIGNHLADKVHYFRDRHAEVRLYVESSAGLSSSLVAFTTELRQADFEGEAWRYLSTCDWVVVEFAQYHELLHYLPALAELSPRPRLIVDYHGVTPPTGWTGPTRRLLELGLEHRGLLWCADRFIVHSDWMRDELIGTTGLDADRVAKLCVPIDGKKFQPNDDAVLPCSPPYLLFVGRVAVNKNVPMLIEALALLRDTDLHLHLVGDVGDLYAAQAEACRRLARDRGVAERVHFRGRLTDADLLAEYRSATAFVIPSRHEGFCVPLVEAMAAGVPVLAARTSALPETLGDAGISFEVDDVHDLVRQIRRVLPAEVRLSRNTSNAPTKKVALVAFRFGAGILGGAEASLASIARSLQRAGYDVEILTTCTRSESDWRNTLPVGVSVEEGLTIRRFPVDPHDSARFHAAVRAITGSAGDVAPEVEAEYLRHGIHSAGLIAHLDATQKDLDAILVGPYLFALVADVVQRFPGKSIVVPCFHDEPIARLKTWRRIYTHAAGWLFHSPEERHFAHVALGLHHPNAREIGTWLPIPAETPRSTRYPKPFLVYAGRYSPQKNVPLLLDWLTRYQTETSGQLDVVFLGEGALKLPKTPWLYDLGRVSEEQKRAILAEARALVQLSTFESLSLVVLEAWAVRTPVIVHRDCAVLRGQLDRSGGGIALATYEEFAAALDDLVRAPWLDRGRHGFQYVTQRYASEADFRAKIVDVVENLRRPLREVMIEAGRRRSEEMSPSAWAKRFDELLETVLARADVFNEPKCGVAEIEPCAASLPIDETTVPVRIHNRGAVPICATGPNRWIVRAYQDSPNEATYTELPAMILPGQSCLTMIHLPTSGEGCPRRLDLFSERGQRAVGQVECATAADAPPPLQEWLRSVRTFALEAQRRQELPADYVDVCEGWWAGWKRWIKRKVLHNFKDAYVDVLSRQQSRVNRDLATAVLQLAEVCQGLEQAVRKLQAEATTRRTANDLSTQEGPPEPAETRS